LLGHIGIPHHFIKRLNMREQLVRQVEIVPIEVVVRNVAAGSLSKRLGIEEGEPLPRTMIEYYYKDDALGDPLITDEHIACFRLGEPGRNARHFGHGDPHQRFHVRGCSPRSASGWSISSSNSGASGKIQPHHPG
jgi:hypothetical protein